MCSINLNLTFYCKMYNSSQIKKTQQEHPVYEDKSDAKRKVVTVRVILIYTL